MGGSEVLGGVHPFGWIGLSNLNENDCMRRLLFIVLMFGSVIGWAVNVRTLKNEKESEAVVQELDSILANGSERFIAQNFYKIIDIYGKFGYKEKAIDVCSRVRKYIAGTQGTDSEMYVLCQIGIASFYNDIGDNYAALDILNECNESLHSGDLQSLILTNLALVYTSLDDYDSAMNCIRPLLESQIKPDTRADYLSYFVGNLLKNLETTAKSYYPDNKTLKLSSVTRSCINELIDLTETYLGKDDTNTLKYRLHLLQFYSLCRDYGSLLTFTAQLEKDFKQIRIPENNRQELLRELSKYYVQLKDYPKALSLFNPNVTTSNDRTLSDIYMGLDNKMLAQESTLLRTIQLLDDLYSYSLSLTEEDRERFWASNFDTFKDPFRYVGNNESSSYVGFLYDIELACKSFLLNSTNMVKRIVLESNNEESISMFNRIVNIRSLLQNSTSLDAQSAEQMHKNVQALEKQLIGLQIGTPGAIQYQRPVWQDIVRKMQDHSLCVEIMEFKDMDDVIHYGALILRKEFEFPRFIIIGKRDEINQKLLNSENGGKDVLSFLLPYLQGVETIYVAPAGLYHNIPFENICRFDSDISVYRVSTTNVLAQNSSSTSNLAALYGGIDYAASVGHACSGSSAKHSHLRTLRPAISEIPYLEGTYNEVVTIDSILTRNVAYKGMLITGAEASESSFRSLSGMSIGVLHIATHGALAFGMNSALLFAGAQKTYDDETYDDLENDGILTAAEISDLDFRNLNLVTLSACDTGLGDITGDGVFGLQRGFKKAGANSILMSLWKVDDEATCKLMTEFYSNWIGKKMTKHDALETAKKTVRTDKKHPQWQDPMYWAAFILLDGLD